MIRHNTNRTKLLALLLLLTAAVPHKGEAQGDGENKNLDKIGESFEKKPSNEGVSGEGGNKIKVVGAKDLANTLNPTSPSIDPKVPSSSGSGAGGSSSASIDPKLPLSSENDSQVPPSPETIKQNDSSSTFESVGRKLERSNSWGPSPDKNNPSANARKYNELEFQRKDFTKLNQDELEKLNKEEVQKRRILKKFDVTLSSLNDSNLSNVLETTTTLQQKEEITEIYKILRRHIIVTSAKKILVSILTATDSWGNDLSIPDKINTARDVISLITEAKPLGLLNHTNLLLIDTRLPWERKVSEIEEFLSNAEMMSRSGFDLAAVFPEIDAIPPAPTQIKKIDLLKNFNKKAAEFLTLGIRKEALDRIMSDINLSWEDILNLMTICNILVKEGVIQGDHVFEQRIGTRVIPGWISDTFKENLYKLFIGYMVGVNADTKISHPAFMKNLMGRTESGPIGGQAAIDSAYILVQQKYPTKFNTAFTVKELKPIVSQILNKTFIY